MIDPAARPRRAAWAGAVAALAMLAHPMGIVAIGAVGIHVLVSPARRRLLPWLALGFAVPAALWGLYALADLDAFTVQLGMQFARKAALANGSFTGKLLRGVYVWEDQYRALGIQLWPLWLLALVGLVATVRQSRGAILAAGLGLFLLTLWSGEMWYPVYASPFLALGLAALFDLPLPLERRLKLGIAVVAGVFVLRVAYRSVEHAASLVESRPRDGTYDRYCSELAAVLPTHARVLVSAIPDPTLCLAARTDLVLRQFAPDRLGMTPERYAAVLQAQDFLVIGRESPSRQVTEFAIAHGTEIARVTVDAPRAYAAVVLRVTGAAGATPRPAPP